MAARWLERFETNVAVGERRVRTLESHRYHLDRHLLPALGRRRIATITAEDIAVESRALQRAAAAVGLEAVRFHDLRHTFASHLIIDLGLDVAQVSRILGYASVTTVALPAQRVACGVWHDDARARSLDRTEREHCRYRNEADARARRSLGSVLPLAHCRSRSHACLDAPAS